jgi:hypothetical protein
VAPGEKEAAQETAAGESQTGLGARSASDSPKTGDESKTEFWAGILGLTLLAIVGIFWISKGKSKR